MFRQPYFFLLFVLLLVMAACGPGERDKRPDDSGSLYFDYLVSGDEETGEVTVRLQYRLEDEDGNGVLLEEPAQVMLDDHILLPDSSRLGGIYYSISLPQEEMEGMHTIIFNNGKRSYQEEFSFPAFRLTGSTYDSALGRLFLDFDGLKQKDYLYIVLTDTAFRSEELSRGDTVRDNRLVLQPADLERLSRGKIYLDLAKEVNAVLKETTRAGGRLRMTYTLSRELELP